MTLTKAAKTNVITTYKTHDGDTGSPEVQIAMLTEKISSVAEHLKSHEMDNHSRRGLIMMVGRRNRLLRYLARTDPQAYQGLIARLGLRK